MNGDIKNIGILGAAGKMGSGITLVVLQERFFHALETLGKVDGFKLVAMDLSLEGLEGLEQYLRKQMSKLLDKKGEKIASLLHTSPSELSKDKIIDDIINCVQFVTNLEALADCQLIFEAIAENIDIKTSVYSQLKKITGNRAFYLTNTSSIPIRVLNDKADLENKIIGFHFYNPPPVQKLVEIITNEDTDPTLVDIAYFLGKQYGKILVPSNDVAGFIGNGHFMRDLLYGISLYKELKAELKDYEAIFAVNKLTQDFLLRPMGIFQLIDYVGLDVCQAILKVMRTFLTDDSLHSDVLDEMLELQVKGGQNADGSQKDGFLKYAGRSFDAVYCISEKKYHPIDEKLISKLDKFLGPLPEGHQPWKDLLGQDHRHDVLNTYFMNLRLSNTNGSVLAYRYLKNSRHIGEMLVNTGVAKNADDVNKVLMFGFYHLYGPINSYVID